MATLHSGNNIQNTNFDSELKYVGGLFVDCARMHILYGHQSISQSTKITLKHYCDKLDKKLLKLKVAAKDNDTAEVLMDLHRNISYLLKATALKNVDINETLKTKYSLHTIDPALKIIELRYRVFLQMLDTVPLTADELIRCHGLQWGRSDVLIGSLRNRAQLNICLEHNFYHVPVNSVEQERIPLSYIAIYQSKNFFGDKSGVEYYGKILTSEIVTRSSITQIPSKSDQLYYKFCVDRWQRLPKRIASNGSGMLFGYTNLYLLLKAQEMGELFFNEEKEYKLYKSIVNAINKRMNRVACKYEDIVISIENNTVYAYKYKRCVIQISIEEFSKRPVLSFKKLINV